MNYSQRVDALSILGDRMLKINAETPVLHQAYLHNNWFTIDMQLKAIHAWGELLSKTNIENWLKTYSIPENVEPKIITVIMAGNIPLVGLHDLISILVTGNIALIKPSSDDTKLINWLVSELIEIEPNFASLIRIAEERQLKNFDAIIATGSNNSHRYFEYYFKDKPNLLRKNRNSVAVLTGNETEEELDKLADDVFLYFGMGCRNVSKLLLPQGYNLEPMFQAFERYKDIINHNKFANNYTYHKALFLMNQDPHLDNGFLILRQDDKLASPLSVLMFEFYENEIDIQKYLTANKELIQCSVGNIGLDGMVPFGKSQDPGLNDYADGIDTIKFILSL